MSKIQRTSAMDKKARRRNVFKAIMVILGAALAAYSYAGDYFDFPGLGDWQGLGVMVGSAIFIVGILLHILDLQSKIDTFANTRPNVVADGFYLEPPFFLFRNGVPSEILERYYVKFRNVKVLGMTIVDTQPVHASVRFFDTNCHLLRSLSHEEAFWAGSGPPWERSHNYSITIKASSKAEELCLFVRQQGGSDLYMFCDKSYISNVRSLEPFQGVLRIPLRKFYICVKLEAANLDMEDVWISVTNLGEQFKPSLELIENPCVKRKNG